MNARPSPDEPPTGRSPARLRPAARRRIWPAVVIAAVCGAGVAAVLFTVGEGSEPEPAAAPEPVGAAVRLTPRTLQFGDTLSADVDVVVDRSVIDPGSVRVRQEFASWGLVTPPRRTRTDSGRTTLVRTSYTLRCVIGPCVPPRETAPLEFDPVRITYRRLDGEAAEPLEARWPVLVVHSNLVASDLEQPDAVTSPWKADLVSFPEASYAVSPSVLRWLLAAAGVLLVLAGALLAYLAVPRKEAEVEVEPEPEPEPELSPLERALLLLTTEVPSDGAADQRRALELVAEEMEQAEEGDLRIARLARMLAWSEETPTLGQTSELAARVREWLVLHAPAEEEAAEEREEEHAPVP